MQPRTTFGKLRGARVDPQEALPSSDTACSATRSRSTGSCVSPLDANPKAVGVTGGKSCERVETKTRQEDQKRRRQEPRLPPEGLEIADHESATCPRFESCRSSLVSPQSMGTSMPWRRALSMASSYPASAWRTTPRPGSPVRTLCRRSAASRVPSQTITRPAWRE